MMPEGREGNGAMDTPWLGRRAALGAALAVVAERGFDPVRAAAAMATTLLAAAGTAIWPAPL